MSMNSILEQQAPSQVATRPAVVEQRFERAVRTLARPAQQFEDEPGCSSRAQRTAARFALLEMMAFNELSSEEKKYAYGAFEHAFAQDDVAPVLLEAIKRDYKPLDFSEQYFASSATQTAKRSGTADSLAAAKAKRDARRLRDQTARAQMKGPSGGGSGKGKKGK